MAFKKIGAQHGKQVRRTYTSAKNHKSEQTRAGILLREQTCDLLSTGAEVEGCSARSKAATESGEGRGERRTKRKTVCERSSEQQLFLIPGRRRTGGRRGLEEVRGDKSHLSNEGVEVAAESNRKSRRGSCL